MKRIKKMVTAICAVTTLAAYTVGMSVCVSAASGTLSMTSSSATLTNTSGAARYGNVNFNVINRSTGSQVKSFGNSGNVANYSSITASSSGSYSTTTYSFTGNATLYNGTSANSGVLWSDSKTY